MAKLPLVGAVPKKKQKKKKNRQRKADTYNDSIKIPE